MKYTREQIAKWFTHGGDATPEQIAAWTAIHDGARSLALLIFETCPATHETEMALDRLQESVTWCNTAISRGATS